MARSASFSFVAVAAALPLLAVVSASPALSQGYPPVQRSYPVQPYPPAQQYPAPPQVNVPDFDDLDDEDAGSTALSPPGQGIAPSRRVDQQPLNTQPSYGSQQQQAYPSNQPYPYPPNQQPAYSNNQPGGVIAPDNNAAAPGSMRPPSDVGAVGSAPSLQQAPGQPGQAAPGQPMQLSALPVEDQPETGPMKELPPHLRRQEVAFQTKEPAGTIIVDTANTHLYLVMGGGRAMRYGVRVGRDGFTWNGTQKITKKAEWPDWHPPAEMIERQPYLPRFMSGGEGNPMGARAMYLGSTVYRIHGTNQPSTIGQFVSSGCVGMLNEDVMDLFERVKVGTRVVVWPGKAPANVAGAAGPATPVPAGASQAARNDLPWSPNGIQPGASLPPLPTQTVR